MATIVLDPGHGGATDALGSSANHAVGPSGTLEKALTLEIATAVARTLDGAGHRVVLTREGDTNLSAAERARIGRTQGADAFVSLHFNASRDAAQQGTEVLVRAAGQDPAAALDEGSRRLAEALRAIVPAALGIADRGLLPGRWAILNPALHDARTARCLVEISFLSDPAEEARLATTAYRDRITSAVARAIASAVDTTTAAQALQHGVVHARRAGGARGSYGLAPRVRAFNHDQLDWCAIRNGIIRSAVEMQGAWLDPNDVLMQESNPAVLEHLEAFWRDGVQEPAWQQFAADSARDGRAWSGAFVSWVVRNAGVPDNVGFRFSGLHMHFIATALRNRMRNDVHSPFWLFGVNEQNVQQPLPGDIVCANRFDEELGAMTQHTFANVRARFWGQNGENANAPINGSSHTEVAIGYRMNGAQRMLETIGGNTGHVTGPAEHTVGTHLRQVDANNVITAPGPIFAFIKIMECNREM